MNTETAKPVVLEGSQIHLRGIQLSDVNDTYCRWMNNPFVTEFLESRFYPSSIESLRDYVTRISADRENLLLAIVVNEGDRHVGNIKLGPINWIHRFAEVGLLIGEKDCWGKGYATQAIRLASEYAFNVLNLHKLNAGCYEPNKGSLKAFQKAGYVQEGLRANHFFYNGDYVGHILLGFSRPPAIKKSLASEHLQK